MLKLAIIGSGHLGLQVVHHAIQTRQFSIAGFYDDFQQVGTMVSGVPVLGNIANVSQAYSDGLFDTVIMAIGYNHLKFKQTVFHSLKDKNIPFATIIHPDAYIDPTAKIGAGSIIYPGCTIDMNVEVGENSLINCGCTIAHDSKIGESCFLSPEVKIAGFTHVSSLVILGIGSVIVDNIFITANTRVGAGSLVTKPITESGIYYGSPAKFIRKIEG